MVEVLISLSTWPGANVPVPWAPVLLGGSRCWACFRTPQASRGISVLPVADISESGPQIPSSESSIDPKDRDTGMVWVGD